MKCPVSRAALKEIWAIFRQPLGFFTGLFGTAIGIVSAYEALLSGNEYYTALLIAFVVCYGVCILAALCWAISTANRSSLKQHVRITRDGYIESIAGDYISTVDILAKRLKGEGTPLDQLYCVIGINHTGNLRKVSEGSVLEAILERIAGTKVSDYAPFEQGKTAIDALLQTQQVAGFQKEIQKAIAALGPEARECDCDSADSDTILKFGTCFCTNLPVANDEKGACPQALFVVNSRIDPVASEGADARNNIVGPSSIDVIPSVFAFAKDLKISHLIMPALGTYRLGNSTQSVIGGIVLRYLAALQSSPSAFNMTITLRETDLERSGTSLSQIKQYTRDAAALFA